MRQSVLQPSLLREDVAEIIRTRILNGAFEQGQPIRLLALAEGLNASATPVREALLMLAQDGWLVHEPNRGFRVATIRRRDVEDIYRVWAYSEGEIAASAARAATADQVAQLWAIDSRIRETPDAQGADALALNEDFHSLIHAVADAPRLLWFVDAARRLAPFRIAESFERVPGWLEVNRTQHAPVITAIEVHDEEAARVAMRDHIDTTGRLLVDWLSQLESWPDED